MRARQLKSMLVGVVLGAVAASTPAFAQSSEQLAAADRLIAAQNMAEMVKSIASSVSATLPPQSREGFIAALTDPAFLKRMTDTTRTTMAKHFTTEELNALADFYSQPVAKSAMAKMGPYTADLMPYIQSEMARIIQSQTPQQKQ